MRISSEPTLEWTIRHVKDYLEGRINIRRFWRPFSGILNYYIDHDFPTDPSHRLSYFWRTNSRDVRGIVQWGDVEAEPEYREYLKLWLDALQRPEEEWREIVKRKGWVLEEYDPDWDK